MGVGQVVSTCSMSRATLSHLFQAGANRLLSGMFVGPRKVDNSHRLYLMGSDVNWSI